LHPISYATSILKHCRDSPRHARQAFW